MSNLLFANFYRLRRSRALPPALAGTLAYTALIVLVCWDHYADGTGRYTLESILTAGFGLIGYVAIPSLIQAPLLAIYLCTENSERTGRNKLIAGYTKTTIYLSELLTCILTAVALDVLFMVLAGALCAWPVLQMCGVLLSVPLRQMLAWIAAALLARAAFASVIKLTSTLMGRKAAAAVAALLLVMGAMLLCEYGFTELHSLRGRMAQGLVPTDGPARAARWQLLLDTLPTGQYLQVSRLDTPHLRRMPPLSLAVIAATTAAGLAVSRKKDVK